MFIHFFIVSYIFINFNRLKSYSPEVFTAKRIISLNVGSPESLFEISVIISSKIKNSVVAELKEEIPDELVLVEGTCIKQGVIDSNHEIKIDYRARLSSNSRISIFKSVDLILYDALMLVGRKIKLEAPGEIYSSKILLESSRIQTVVRDRIANPPIGISTNPFIGHDEEFISIKTYEEGDSIRYIHWKKTAALQTDDLLVKKFEKLGEKKISIVVDCSPSLNAGMLNSYFNEVASAVLTITRAALDSGNIVKIYLLNPEIPIQHLRETTIRNLQDAKLKTAMIFPASQEAPSFIKELFSEELQKGSYVAIFTNPPSINDKNLKHMISKAIAKNCKIITFIPLIHEYYQVKSNNFDLTSLLKIDNLLKQRWASSFGEKIHVFYISPTSYMLDIKRVFMRRYA
jgi:uncharacterized protein (DUF58 family)